MNRTPETRAAGPLAGAAGRRADLIEAGRAAQVAGVWPLLVAGLAMLAAARASWWAVAGGVALTLHEWALLGRLSKGGGWRRSVATAVIFLLPFCAMLPGWRSPQAAASAVALYAAGLAAVPTVARAMSAGLKRRGLGRISGSWRWAYAMSVAGVALSAWVYARSRNVAFAEWGWTLHVGDYVSYFRLVLLFPFCAAFLVCGEAAKRLFAAAAVAEDGDGSGGPEDGAPEDGGGA